MLSDKGRSVKGCMFVGAESKPGCDLNQTIQPRMAGFSPDAHREVFLKTLSIFVTVASKRCHAVESAIKDKYADIHEDSSMIDELSPPFDIHARLDPVCDGSIHLHMGSYGKPYIRCEHWHKGHKGHLLITKLDEYDIKYLTALFENDTCYIRMVELDAKVDGYGPLHSCGYVAVRREQKQLCPHWHRYNNGKLEWGILEPQKECQAQFKIYVPNDLPSCPQIIIVSRNATPQRLSLDSAFMAALRSQLLWTGLQDPLLSALHPSSGNMDHTAHLIDLMRSEYFPNGTGLKGANELCLQHKLLPMSEQYVWAVETVTIPRVDPFMIIICMLPSMSEFLMSMKQPTIDTSFKRADGFEEFEIEAWFPDEMKLIVCACIFITSASAPAHLAMFKLMFKIAESDTGVAVRFKHIHGSGYEVMVADAHKGQALGELQSRWKSQGVGQLCIYLSQYLIHKCVYSCACALSTLSPYEHLTHFYCLCINHFQQGIHKLGNIITDEVRAAMHSLSSSFPILDLEGTKELIQRGGSKSAAWMNNKEIGSPFVIPAIYQPARKIPLEIWQSAPATSNGNEQPHRNINRDGTGLMLLAAIIWGLQYDVHAVRSVGLMREAGIHQRDQELSYFRCAGRSVLHSSESHGTAWHENVLRFNLTPVRIKKRKLASIDKEL
ncbi:hypothetical protein K439DRAFT_1665328 [Ramaria rubella]|nr:hypothetical protein K439DRAFT_1665328 [Ramaria rubella]